MQAKPGAMRSRTPGFETPRREPTDMATKRYRAVRKRDRVDV
jgi:hypothetical protein